jgi:hypothetical protein
MNRYWIPLAVTAALGLVPGLQAADAPRPVRFGTLEGLGADAAKPQAAAWLKASNADAATLEKFELLWKSDASVLDKTVRTFELGNPEVAKLMASARNPLSPAPTEVPALLKNQELPVFFRANLALGYGRALSMRSVHEEALEMMKMFPVEQVVDPAAYLFHRAVSEHAMLDKNAANTSINRLLDDAASAPERYRTLAALMALDIHTWKEKDLSAIARKMKDVERRLDLSRGGPKTQKVQKDIVARLDELIKELENKDKSKGKGQGQGQGQGEGNCPAGGPGGEGGPKGDNPSSPATESGIAGGAGTGTVDKAKLSKLVQQWGNLPPRERAEALQQMTQGMSPRHREAIENYFKNLAIAQSRK